jgi:antigen 43
MSAPDINNYTTLNTYAVLAYSGITTVNTTTVTNGFYGSSPTPSYTGTFVGTQDSGNAGAAQTELISLRGDIEAYRTSLGAQTSIPAPVSGVITLLPNVNYSTTAITFSGVSIVLDATGVSNAQFFITSGSFITFANVSSITLINASTCNVFWLTNTAITFTGNSPTPTIPGIYIAGTQITFANASNTIGRLYAQRGNITFSGTSSVNGLDTFVCYLKGTKILTENGYINIEDLSVGDNVVTKGKIHDDSYLELNENYSVEPVKWIGNFKTSICNEKSLPICIKANALGNNSPNEDLYVSPLHRIIIDGKMVCAKDMVNGTTIYQDINCESIHYYHLELNDHASIIANGVLSETYKDFDNRYVFENSKSVNELTIQDAVLA